LLDSYESELVPVAERLLRRTDQAFSLIVSDRWGAGQLRARILPKIFALAMKRGAKLDDTRFNLILFGQHSVPDPLSGHDGLVLIHRVPDEPVNDAECARSAQVLAGRRDCLHPENVG